MKAPIFSTYRQGENRVTSSMLAVFERVDLSLVERLLGAAAGESSFEMIHFTNQVVGQGSVPDAEIRASFQYLFEVKTARDAVRSRQLRKHLQTFDGGNTEERLFVVTPDTDVPATVAALDDPRVIWFNFASLAQAIDALLVGGEDVVGEREAFLLRELRRLFEADGLLALAEDIVVVAARFAHSDYHHYGAYICQAGRTFRPGIQRIGFYCPPNLRSEAARS